MKSLAELCRPRASVFEDTTTDDVLDIANLPYGTIDVLAEQTSGVFKQGNFL